LKGKEVLIMEEDSDFNIIANYWNDIYITEKKKEEELA